MSNFYVLFAVIVAIVVVYKFPGILPESWRPRSGQELYDYMFRLKPGETIVHQLIGISDPNSHLTKAEVTKKNLALGLVGEKIKDESIIHIALTSMDRLILSYDPRVEPVPFEKNDLPHIVDTGRTAKRMSSMALKYIKNFPQNSGETRMVEIDSPLIPDLIIHGNTGKFELSMPVEFIPILMDWMKKQTGKDDI